MGTTPLKFRKQFRQAWEQKNSQKWKNDIDTESALKVLESYLLSDKLKNDYDFPKKAGGVTLILLEPDVAKIFPNTKSVNEALRAFAKIMHQQNKTH